MLEQHLSQELGIDYYRTMSKFEQFRRNVSKNSISAIKTNFLPNDVVQEAIP